MNKIFLSGEKIDLCVPEEVDFEEWSNWFNNQQITSFLDQGKYPHTKTNQIDFYNSAMAEGRFLTTIKSKQSTLLGVISLSEINYEKSSCQIALVCPVKSESAPLAALEAMALTTYHAFQRFGVERVWAGQAYPELTKWTQKLEILGYKTDGFTRNGFKHGIHISNAVHISILKEDFLRLVERRNGNLWPGETKAQLIYEDILAHPSEASQLYKEMIRIHTAQNAFLDDVESKYE